MRRAIMVFLLSAGAVFAFGEEGKAQELLDLLAVGEPAPDIQVTGATRHGVLADPVSLSDLRGETVVIAFFFRARTGG